ncbi:MAG: D-alanine--D-alanine ligase [Planctomycetota bacterium]|nr:D-alanine--D-alanine ligase [Planctomycetota bacterium]
MRITVLHNAVPPDARDDELDVLVQVAAVTTALVQLGHIPTAWPCTLDLETLRRQLTEARPDVVFNLTEGLGGTDRLQHVAPSLLEALDLPYTGAPAVAHWLTNDKLLAKTRFQDAGLPTPTWAVADTAPGLSISGPMIIKAIYEHASVGMDDTAIVTCRDGRELAARIREVEARLGKPCFAEQFVDGREFNLSLLAGPHGPQALPPAEIDFGAFPPDKPRIVGYSAKWQTDSFEFVNTPRCFDFPEADAGLLTRLSDLACRCWAVFGLRDYNRVDFRVDRDGQPLILEINTNPCLSPDAGFTAALERAGIGYAEAMQRIIDDALPPPESLGRRKTRTC